MGKLYVEGSVIHVKKQGDIDLVCLTDIAKVANPKNPDKVLYKYMRQKSTVELIILHERQTNLDFNLPKDYKFELLSDKRGIAKPLTTLRQFNCKCIVTNPGSHEGTYAPIIVAYDFAQYVSTEFRYFLLKEFDEYQTIKGRTKQFNNSRKSTKLHARMLTRVINDELIPFNATDDEAERIHAREFNRLNMIVYNLTAKKWREDNPNKSGNIRDDTDYTDSRRLQLMDHLQVVDAMMIKSGILGDDREYRLYEEAHDFLERLEAEDSEREDEDDMYVNTSYYARKTVKPVTPKLKKKVKMYEEFQKDVKSGKVRYDKKDETFRDKDGFIRLGFKNPLC